MKNLKEIHPFVFKKLMQFILLFEIFMCFKGDRCSSENTLSFPDMRMYLYG